MLPVAMNVLGDCAIAFQGKPRLANTISESLAAGQFI
jgi:hypothetical protein